MSDIDPEAAPATPSDCDDRRIEADIRSEHGETLGGGSGRVRRTVLLVIAALWTVGWATCLSQAAMERVPRYRIIPAYRDRAVLPSVDVKAPP